MPNKPALAAPSIAPLELRDLDDGDVARLEAHGMVDATRFEGGDVSGDDLSGLAFSECELISVTAHETQFRAARFVSTRLERMNAPVFLAARSTFRDAEIVRSRMGSMELYESDVQEVTISGSKLGWVNLRAARLRDVRFTGCTIDELDLSGAQLARVAFEDCVVETLRLDGARLTHVDLRGLDMHVIAGVEGMRGATLSHTQATLMAPLFAEHLGIKVDG
ncbi:pentapeptide repeat-containing protein [Microbacterium protaetiae]|uniref:Pentapeptide repeat-containing protein n=1 Tax=Microbacterium protaetiae TaxID=2509458 RepID=A0A4P6EIY9_9MICO|nr:pentapeptide repeat-containing protein [Microbacterium protaetiae]QAY60147.1 pentapeptide repeat-containing protein [Microbacterium protaetiae]